MIKKIIIVLFISTCFLSNTPAVMAGTGPLMPSDDCTGPADTRCIEDYSCQLSRSLPNANPPIYLCQRDVFGQIQPPDALKGFLAKDPTGAGAISQFLSNFVVLIFSVAGVVLILMIVWGAFDWIISEGDKEKVASARNKIINAIIGIILFALAFAIIQVLGTFTGFKFFKGS